MLTEGEKQQLGDDLLLEDSRAHDDQRGAYRAEQ